MAWNLLEKTETPSTATTPPKVKIAILLPHTGSMNMEVVEHFWNPLKNQQLDWCEKCAFLSRVPSLPLARNILCEEFLKTDCTHALWIDSDHLYEKKDGTIGNPNEALALLYRCLQETGEHIVTALYRAKQKHGFNYAIWKDAPPEATNGEYGYEHIGAWEGNWFEVAVAGMGMMLMTREVLSKMAEANKIYDSNFFHWEKPDSQSEDFDFLKKAKVLGFKTWCFSDVRLTHGASVFLNSKGEIRVPAV